MYGLLLALVSAALFGAATPAGKVLLADFTPFQLAGLLYVGAALGVGPIAALDRRATPGLDRTNRMRLAGAVVFGGVVGPVLLLFGLRFTAAGSTSPRRRLRDGGRCPLRPAADRWRPPRWMRQRGACRPGV